MRPALALLALAVVVLAAWSRAGNTRSVKGARLTAGDHGAPDDSEVVGMPTTWTVEPRALSAPRLSSLAELVMTGYGCPCGNRVPCEAHPLVIQ